MQALTSRCLRFSRGDCVGPIARDPADIVALAEILEQNPSFGVAIASKEGGPRQEFRGLAVGVVSSTWGVHESLVAGKWGDARVVSTPFI